jgi:hypothetical protein
MKVVRQAADVAGDVAAAFEQFVKRVGDGGRRTRRAQAQALDVHAQEHQLLAQVVVQLAGETGPLRFLGGNQPAGEMLGFLVTRTQCRFAGSQRVLCEAPPGPLHEQRRDERRLRQA